MTRKDCKFYDKILWAEAILNNNLKIVIFIFLNFNSSFF